MTRSAKVGARRRTQSYVERRDPKRDKARRKKRPPHAQLSKSGAGIFMNRLKLNRAMSGLIRFSFICELPVKATTRGDNQA
jgi:hypothetical protein